MMNTIATPCPTTNNSMPARHRIKLNDITREQSAPKLEINRNIQVLVPEFTYFMVNRDFELSVTLGHLDDHNWYLFSTKLLKQFAGTIWYKTFPVVLYLGITDEQQLFLLPSTEALNRNFVSWNDSLNRLIIRARSCWVKRASNHKLKVHEKISEEDPASYGEPQWPDLLPEEILSRAFPEEFYVSHPDHPAVARFCNQQRKWKSKL